MTPTSGGIAMVMLRANMPKDLVKGFEAFKCKVSVKTVIAGTKKMHLSELLKEYKKSGIKAKVSG